MTATIVGMIYKSMAYLDFMWGQLNRYCLSQNSDVGFLIIANDATKKVLDGLVEKNIPHAIYNDPKPDDYYLNRVYRAWNFGGIRAPGDIIVFVNSDFGYSPGWLDSLLSHLERDTLPCSRLVESNKMLSGKYALKGEFGRHPKDFNNKGWLDFAETNKKDTTGVGGLYMPCAFFKKDFIKSGGYPEGNIYEGGVGNHYTPFKMSGDDWFFHHNEIMKNKRHITCFNSLVYHIIEGEKDE